MDVEKEGQKGDVRHEEQQVLTTDAPQRGRRERGSVSLPCTCMQAHTHTHTHTGPAACQTSGAELENAE